MRTIYNNADFLYLFSEDEGFKFLTHDFIVPEESDFLSYLASCRSRLLDYKGLIEESLYNLVFGFMYGPSWTDPEGHSHAFSCSSEKCIRWCENNPHIHPKNNERFSLEFETFRKSIRFYKTDLDKLIKKLCSSKYPFFNCLYEDLKSANVYVNVSRFALVFERILNTMTDQRFRTHRDIKISYHRCEPEGQYLVSKLVVEQIGSFPTYTLGADVERRVRSGGGDLGAIKCLCKDTCFWSIESNWMDGPARINIVAESEAPAIEPIPSDSVEGFRHTLTMIHRTI
jgi:hypothetical protein